MSSSTNESESLFGSRRLDDESPAAPARVDLSTAEPTTKNAKLNIRFQNRMPVSSRSGRASRSTAARWAALPRRSTRRSSGCSEKTAASAHEQNADAAVSAGAVHLAIQSRLNHSFHGGGGAGAGGAASKDWLQELARERRALGARISFDVVPR